MAIKINAYTKFQQPKIPITTTLSQITEFVPKMMLTNVMSLVPKIDELCILTHQHSLDAVFVTESWSRESVCDNHATLFDYHLVRRDRTFSLHGGVCMYIKNSITFKRLPEYEHLDFEVLWTYIRPSRLPRGVNGIVTACVYHPPSSCNTYLFEYLSDSLAKLKAFFRVMKSLLQEILTILTVMTFAVIFN